MSIIFGLDFGTSNSALSVNIAGKVNLVDIDPFNYKKNILKSVIYYDANKRKFSVGQQAVDLYIKNDATGRYVQSVKSFLPNTIFDRTAIGGKLYDLEQLIAILLTKIKNRGEKVIGKEVSDVVLGRPVFFSEDKAVDMLAEKRLVSAAKIAGFNNVYLQFEPIAAALSYENSLHKGEEKVVLVGDFGGGTSDFTIIKIKGGIPEKTRERKSDILSTGGVYIGGDLFDSNIMWERLTPYFGRNLKLHDMQSKIMGGEAKNEFPLKILKNLCKWHDIAKLRTPKTFNYIHEAKYLADNKVPLENLENLIEDNYGYYLFMAIEKVKCALSSDDYAHFTFEENTLLIDELITKIEFEKIIQSDVSSIKSCVKRVLSDANLKFSDLDTIFLTGGSSYIPCIKTYFRKKFDEKKIIQNDAFTSVAHGLGICGHMYM